MNKKLIIVALSLILFSNVVIAKNYKLYPGTKIKYSISGINYIKKNIKHGVLIKLNKDLLQKIIIGLWELEPNVIMVYDNKNYYVYQLDPNVQLKYKGEWKVNDNVLLLKNNKSKDWQEWEIKKIIYKKSKSNAYRNMIEVVFDFKKIKKKYKDDVFMYWSIFNTFN